MIRYNVNTGIEKIKSKSRKYIASATAGVFIAGAAAVPALAAGPGAGSSGSKASACGAVHGAFADQNGNFGWLGAEGGAAGYHGMTGQEPGATGYNNSHTDCQQ
jgi:hypothetical protein